MSNTGEEVEKLKQWSLDYSLLLKLLCEGGKMNEMKLDAKFGVLVHLRQPCPYVTLDL